MIKDRVAYLIPHYNNLSGLEKSIRSINESFEVDVVVVDDGSSVKPNEMELNQLGLHGIVHVLNLENNSGIEIALNEGLKFIKKNNYTYIARLDCGDESVKDRVKKQLKLFHSDPEIKLVGSFAAFVDLNDKEQFVYKVPTRHDLIKKKMFLKVMFIHPSVMYSTEVLDTAGYYPMNYKAAEDYAYFFRILKRHKTSNVAEVLVRCEFNYTGISSQKRRIQIRSKFRVLLRNFYWGSYPLMGLGVSILQLILPAEVFVFLKKKGINVSSI